MEILCFLVAVKSSGVASTFVASLVPARTCHLQLVNRENW